MEKHYTHLAPEERGLIMEERHRVTSRADIARMLGRSPSKISRELRHNTSCSVTYNAINERLPYRICSRELNEADEEITIIHP